MKSGESSFATVAAFAMALLHPRLGTGIVLILVIFILLDRDHISDQVVRLVGSSNVHATSEALEDAANRVGRVLLLQVLTNFGFAIAVSAGLFAFGTPNAILWGLLAGMLRFIPYVGAAIGAILPTLISFAVFSGWLQPLLVQPYQQIYRRLIRRAASEGSAVALARSRRRERNSGWTTRSVAWSSCRKRTDRLTGSPPNRSTPSSTAPTSSSTSWTKSQTRIRPPGSHRQPRRLRQSIPASSSGASAGEARSMMPPLPS